MLKVKRLTPEAILPTIAHPGEDLGYDLYALEGASLVRGVPNKIRTGIAAQAYKNCGHYDEPLGMLVRDRSSMASKGVIVTGGVVDPGYIGEIQVILTFTDFGSYGIKAGDKIAQLVPVPALTGEIIEVNQLHESARGEKGFGSSGT